MKLVYLLIFSLLFSTSCTKIVFIKTSTHKFSINVEPKDTINEVKLKIQREEGIPYNKQRLYFNGRRLNDHLTVASYKIKKESIMHLVHY